MPVQKPTNDISKIAKPMMMLSVRMVARLNRERTLSTNRVINSHQHKAPMIMNRYPNI